MRASNNTEWLFHNLWKTNPETLMPFPCINIPETLIYRWGQPQSWYSTTKDGQIIQKTKDKFSPQNMEDAFANNLPKCEVIASAITSYDDPALKFQEKMEFEYIMKPDFHEFLAQPEKQHNIILQKFVEPKGGQNAVIKVSWTPQFCLLFRKTNINDINNQKIHLLNRLVTFEGYEHLSNSDSISSPVLATELEQTCLNIVKHIQAVTNGNVRILKITLYFKLDDKNRLWLLYCTGLKVRDKGRNSISGVLFKKKNERPLSPVMMVTTRKEREAHKNKIPLQYLHEEQVNQIGDKECFKCGQENLLFDMKLKNLLEYEEKILKSVRASFIKQAEESEIVEGPLFFGKLLTPEKVRSNVPAVMKKLYPTLTDDRYVKLKKNISLMNLSVKVCEACYLAVTENVLENSEEPSASRIQSQMMERIRRERDFFGYSSSPGNRRVSSRKSGSEKALRVMTFHAKGGMDTDSSPWSTDRETNQTKRLSTLDNLQRADEAQPEPKFGRPSAFFYMKSAQQERVKSAFSLKKADIPHIGIPEINDFKIADLNFASYSVATTKTNLFDQYDRTKINVAPMRQARSPYANEMRPVSGLRKEFRSSDAIKKAVNVPRPPSKEKVSLETTWKNSVASIWKKDRSHLAHRTNYSSIMNTIKDLKSVLNESLGEIEAK